MQAQVATLCGLIQLRRDHYLALVKGLQTQEIQTLRNLPLLGLVRLFPDATLRDIDSAVTKGLTTKALVQSTSGKTVLLVTPRRKTLVQNKRLSITFNKTGQCRATVFLFHVRRPTLLVCVC